MKNILSKIAKIFTYIIFAFLLLVIVGIITYVIRINYLASQDRLGEIKTNFYTILTQSMYPTIKAGDIVVTYREDDNIYEKKDIITFISEANGNITITHRVLDVYEKNNEYSYKTKGDNNRSADNEIIPSYNVLGKVIFKIPKAGYIQQFLVSRTGWIVAILLPSLGIIIYDVLKIFKKTYKKRKIVDDEDEEVKKRKQELNKIMGNEFQKEDKLDVNSNLEVNNDINLVSIDNGSQSNLYSMFNESETNQIEQNTNFKIDNENNIKTDENLDFELKEKLSNQEIKLEEVKNDMLENNVENTLEKQNNEEDEDIELL